MANNLRNVKKKSEASTPMYVSCIKIDGVPILPPVLNDNQRGEMRHYRELALQVQQDLLKLQRDLRLSDTSLSDVVASNSSSSESSLDDFPSDCSMDDQTVRSVVSFTESAQTDVLKMLQDKPNDKSQMKEIKELPLVNMPAINNVPLNLNCIENAWGDVLSITDISIDKKENCKDVDRKSTVRQLSYTVDSSDKNKSDNILKLLTCANGEEPVLKLKLCDKDILNVNTDLRIENLESSDENCISASENLVDSEMHRLVRSNSYILDKPSPMLLAQMERELIEKEKEITAEIMSNSPPKRKMWNTEKYKETFGLLSLENKTSDVKPSPSKAPSSPETSPKKKVGTEKQSIESKVVVNPSKRKGWDLANAKEKWSSIENDIGTPIGKRNVTIYKKFNSLPPSATASPDMKMFSSTPLDPSTPKQKPCKVNSPSPKATNPKVKPKSACKTATPNISVLLNNNIGMIPKSVHLLKVNSQTPKKILQPQAELQQRILRAFTTPTRTSCPNSTKSENALIKDISTKRTQSEHKPIISLNHNKTDVKLRKPNITIFKPQSTSYIEPEKDTQSGESLNGIGDIFPEKEPKNDSFKENATTITFNSDQISNDDLSYNENDSNVTVKYSSIVPQRAQSLNCSKKLDKTSNSPLSSKKLPLCVSNKIQEPQKLRRSSETDTNINSYLTSQAPDLRDLVSQMQKSQKHQMDDLIKRQKEEQELFLRKFAEQQDMLMSKITEVYSSPEKKKNTVIRDDDNYDKNKDNVKVNNFLDYSHDEVNDCHERGDNSENLNVIKNSESLLLECRRLIDTENSNYLTSSSVLGCENDNFVHPSASTSSQTMYAFNSSCDTLADPCLTLRTDSNVDHVAMNNITVKYLGSSHSNMQYHVVTSAEYRRSMSDDSLEAAAHVTNSVYNGSNIVAQFQKNIHVYNNDQPRKIGSCSKILFPSSKQVWAADIICAVARGYLVRRLLKTERVQNLIQTIKDTLLCAMQLHQETVENIQPSDIELHRRLIQQVTAACCSFHDMFFRISIKEQMIVIAQDRERQKEKLLRPLSARSSSSLSATTQRVIERKLRRQSSTDLSSPTVRPIFSRSCHSSTEFRSRARSVGPLETVQYKKNSPPRDSSMRRSMNYGANKKPWR